MARGSRSRRVVRFGAFKCDLGSGELCRNGYTIYLADQPLQVLAMLLERPGELVTREDFKEQLWPGQNSGDFNAGLNNAVNKLRAVLNDSADRPRFIQTIPRRGYRFIASVQFEEVQDVVPVADNRHEPATKDSADLSRRDEKASGGQETDSRSGLVLRRALAAVGVVGALFALWWFVLLPSQTRSDQITRFSISPPEGYRVAPGPWAPEVAVSPDGRTIAAVLADSRGAQSLWIRPLARPAFQRLEGTEGADLPFWAPDSQSVGFFASGELRKIALAGGRVQTLCAAAGGEGGAWGRSGAILYGQRHGPLMRVPAAGGEPVPATDLQKGKFRANVWPQFLPDGKHFLYLALASAPQNGSPANSVLIGSLDSHQAQLAMTSEAAARFCPPNHLLFVRRGNLFAQPFDTRRMRLYGDPVRVSGNVAAAYWGRAAFSVSHNGVLVFRSSPPGDPGDVAQLIWRDRTGARLGQIGHPGAYEQMVLSPDGKLVALQLKDGSVDHLGLLDLGNGVFSQLTFGPESQVDPVWSSDSQRILYANYKEPGSPLSIMELKLGGSQPRQIYSDARAEQLDDWSPNGRFVIYHDNDDVTFHFLSLSGHSLLNQPVRDASHRDQFHFSPDGKWVAYNSDETRVLQTYVASFPGLGQKQQISDSGGGEPIWRADGRELYYLSLDWRMMAVPLKTDGGLQAGAPQVLFQADVLNPFGEGGGDEYSVTRDGRKFLLLEPVKTESPAGATAEQINVIVNWDAALQNK
jgi:DNA-binding winged helix-turn-helix (wHTH) protein/Tol biopolymer transport system component